MNSITYQNYTGRIKQQFQKITQMVSQFFHKISFKAWCLYSAKTVNTQLVQACLARNHPQIRKCLRHPKADPNHAQGFAVGALVLAEEKELFDEVLKSYPINVDMMLLQKADSVEWSYYFKRLLECATDVEMVEIKIQLTCASVYKFENHHHLFELKLSRKEGAQNFINQNIMTAQPKNTATIVNLEEARKKRVWKQAKNLEKVS